MKEVQFKSISQSLYWLRVAHDVRASDLAKEIGKSKSYISEIERGIKKPSIEIIALYSKVFGVPMSSILFLAERMNDNGQISGTLRFPKKVLAILQMIRCLQGVENAK